MDNSTTLYTSDSPETTSTLDDDNDDDDEVDLNITAVYLPPLIILVLFTFLANLVVILCVYIDQKLRKPTNLYVVSLAAADALVGLAVMNGMLVYTIYGLWPLSDALCTIWVSSDFICCTVSLIHLCLIAHDRYQALVKPHIYKSPNRTKHILIKIGVAWILGVLIWMPAIIGFRIQQDPVPYDCFFIPVKQYVLASSILVYFLPILVMVYVYIMCLYGLRVQYRKIQDSDGVIQAPEPEASTTITATTRGQTGNNQPDPKSFADSGLEASVSHLDTRQVPKENGQREIYNEAPSTNAVTKQDDVTPHVVKQKRQRRRQEHIRSIRTLGVIIIIFLFCWLPFCIFWPIAAYCSTCIPLKWYEYSYWAAYLNSSVNPVLYFICNRDFRSAFKKLLSEIRKKMTKN